MAWPADDLHTTNMDSDSDSPAAARPMFVRLVNRVKSIIAARGVPNGIATLDASGKIPVEQLPDGGGAGTLLWSPAGAYQQVATGQTVLNLLSSANAFRRLRFEVDYQIDEIAGDSEANPPADAVSGRPYLGFDEDKYVYRASLPTSSTFATLVTGEVSRTDPAARNHFTLGVQLTSANTITVQLTASGAGLRLYGIHGSAT